MTTYEYEAKRCGNDTSELLRMAINGARAFTVERIEMAATAARRAWHFANRAIAIDAAPNASTYPTATVARAERA